MISSSSTSSLAAGMSLALFSASYLIILQVVVEVSFIIVAIAAMLSAVLGPSGALAVTGLTSPASVSESTPTSSSSARLTSRMGAERPGVWLGVPRVLSLLAGSAEDAAGCWITGWALSAKREKCLEVVDNKTVQLMFASAAAVAREEKRLNWSSSLLTLPRLQ